MPDLLNRMCRHLTDSLLLSGLRDHRRYFFQKYLKDILIYY